MEKAAGSRGRASGADRRCFTERRSAAISEDPFTSATNRNGSRLNHRRWNRKNLKANFNKFKISTVGIGLISAFNTLDAKKIDRHYFVEKAARAGIGGPFL